VRHAQQFTEKGQETASEKKNKKKEERDKGISQVNYYAHRHKRF